MTDSDLIRHTGGNHEGPSAILITVRSRDRKGPPAVRWRSFAEVLSPTVCRRSFVLRFSPVAAEHLTTETAQRASRDPPQKGTRRCSHNDENAGLQRASVVRPVPSSGRPEGDCDGWASRTTWFPLFRRIAEVPFPVLAVFLHPGLGLFTAVPRRVSWFPAPGNTEPGLVFIVATFL